MLLTPTYGAPTVTRLRAATVLDSDGDPVKSWTVPDRLKLRGATVQSVSSIEEEGGTKRIVQGEKTLFAPGAVDVKADDRIEVGAEIWRVNGVPEVLRGLASGVYTTAALTRITSG